jgi:type II secretory pathway pseudopilin PulG
MFCSERSRKQNSVGLTLIEFLISVGIIAIAALICLPNYYEASQRSPVSGAQSDLRGLVTGLESYFVEQGCYPSVTDANRYLLSARLRVLTTPVAYLTKLPPDVFGDPQNPAFPPGAMDTYYYDRVTTGTAKADSSTSYSGQAGWRLISAGPDRVFEYGVVIYDATNGTESRGDIVLTSDNKKK